MLMHVLQSDYILKTLELPTIEWKEYYPDAVLDENLLWSVKTEKIPGKSHEDTELVKKKRALFQFIKDRRCLKKKQRNSLLGVDSKTAKAFAEKLKKQVNTKTHAIVYYPYYTVVKSGIIDINRERIVIEGTKGDVSNLTTHNYVEVTMIFKSDDLEIMGDETFFTKEETIPLIDYGKEIKKMATRDLELNKNLQLYFSYVYKTNIVLKLEGEIRLIFHKFKIF